MESPENPIRDPCPPAIVTFPAGLADRRIAGVAAAARVVRSLTEAGIRDVRLETEPAPATRADIARIASAAIVTTSQPTAEVEPIRLPGDRLLSPGEIRLAMAGAAAGWPEGLRLDAPDAARRILRLTGKASDGLVSRWINRPVSRRISEGLLILPWIRPGHATALTALAAAAMLACLLLGGAAGAAWGAVLFQAASILDGVDGEIARATFRASARGAALDTAVDVATNLLFVLGLTVNLAAQYGPEIALVGGAGLLLFAAGLVLLAAKARRGGEPASLDLLKRFSGDRAGMRDHLARFVTTVTSRDFFAFLFMVLALAGWTPAILYIFAGAAVGWLPIVVAAGFADPLGRGVETTASSGSPAP